jgi:type I restriction enzyme S subunit
VDLTPRLFYQDTFAHAADAGRFDAEYYQPAKWNVLRTLAAMPGKPLEEHFRPVKKLWQPSDQPATAIVRNYDLTDALTPFLDDTTPTATAGEIKSTKKRFEPGDLVISRLRSYLKEIAVVLAANGTPQVGSTEFIVLRSRKTKLSAEALLVFLRSAPVQTVLKWCQDGSNHPRFAEKELFLLPVPDTVLKVQENISAKIKEATAARQESLRLLDEAKGTIEETITGTVSSAQQNKPKG